ncbi:MAG: glycosyltransferase family 4 protein [Chloroflexi bacterium]|nr:glycosyltransferase family 4 protein [Chloroflexota bacterium]
MRILLATDVFPPRCGGSGWSTYHLARALRERGHAVSIVRAALNLAHTAAYEFDGFRVTQIATLAPPVPVLRNVAKNEVFWHLGGQSLARHAFRLGADIIHGQHVMTIPAAAQAGRRLGAPVVATVRDYWPTCPISTRLRPDGICTHCSSERLIQCVAGHRPVATRVASLLAGYVVANRRRRQAALRAVDRVIAVSSYVAADLRHHAGIDAVVVPNMVDVPPSPLPPPPELASLDSPAIVFVGKLDAHKGADRLPAIVASAGQPATLVVIGDGPLRERLTAECRERGVPLRLLTEAPNIEVLRWLAHTRALVTPARWPEPLSRVGLEAASVGCPIVSTPVGGAADAIVDGDNGFLATDDATLAHHVRQLLCDDDLHARQRTAAIRLARTRFATPVVVSQMETLYQDVVARRGQ